MQLDKKSLDRLLKLNDDQLRGVLGKLLAEYGVDVSRVPLAQMDMTALRAVLSAATDEDRRVDIADTAAAAALLLVQLAGRTGHFATLL